MGNLLMKFLIKTRNLLHWEMLPCNWLLMKKFSSSIKPSKRKKLLLKKSIERNTINCCKQRKNWARSNINSQNSKTFNHQSILNPVYPLNSSKSNPILRLKFPKVPNMNQKFKNLNSLLRQNRNTFVNYKNKTKKLQQKLNIKKD